MVCVWVMERSLKKIRMNSSVMITMAYSNVSWVVQLSMDGWVIASEVIQENPCKIFTTGSLPTDGITYKNN